MRSILVVLPFLFLSIHPASASAAEKDEPAHKYLIKYDQSTKLYSLHDCGTPSPQITKFSCNEILSDISSADRANLPQTIRTELQEFKNSDSYKWARRNMYIYTGVAAVGAVACVLSAGGCVWAPILIAADSSLAGGLALGGLEVLIGVAAYKANVTYDKVSSLEREVSGIVALMDDMKQNGHSEAVFDSGLGMKYLLASPAVSSLIAKPGQRPELVERELAKTGAAR